MSYIPGEDAEGLRAVVRDFLDKWSPESEVRSLSETATGYDRAVWMRAAEELGLHGIAVPEEYGGSGGTPVELGLVFEEMGARLYAAPFFATVGLATTALVEAAGGELAAQRLPGILDGSTVATLAWAGTDAPTSTLHATSRAAQWTVSGTAPSVVDGAVAHLVLVAARTPDGTGLFAVDDPDGLRRTALTTLDPTRRLAELMFDSTPVTRLDQGEGLSRTADVAALYLAAEQLGGARETLARTVEYASTRVQFGRAIGSFQAVKHRCADMLVDVESARSTVYHGLWTAVHDPVRLPVAAALARTVASDAFQRVATDSIQLHGGIGFTWEHPAHLYLKRAKSSQLLLGHPRLQRRRLAELIDLRGAGGIATAAPPPSAEAAPDGALPDTSELTGDVCTFLRKHPPPDPADPAADRAFREARFDAGLAIVELPVGLGGRGLDPSLQPEVEQRFAEAGVADHIARNVIGLGMAVPTIAAHGTDEQRRRFLRPCFSGEEIWCQLFSEPGAGSDLAALSTRAVRDGDDFVVDGQKIWTSLGHVASWGILVARTDSDVPKHRGLTYFLLDMATPGVEVRPLRQLTGEAEFNEVYLTGVRIPPNRVLGEVGQGWRVAMTTLANERVSLGGRAAARGAGPVEQVVRAYRAATARGDVDAADTAVVERLMLEWTRAEAARLTNVRAAAQVDRVPGPEGAIAKLQMAESNKAIYELCVDLSGTDGLLIDDYTETRPDVTAVHGGSDLRKAYLRSLANSIEGGTSEILRNILGERVLGLPGEPRVDRDIPWKETRRS